MLKGFLFRLCLRSDGPDFNIARLTLMDYLTLPGLLIIATSSHSCYFIIEVIDTSTG